MALEDIGIRVLVLGTDVARRATKTVQGDLEGLGHTISRLTQRSITFGDRIQRLGTGMIQLGRTMSLELTLPLAVLEGALVNAGVQFQDTFAGVTKTVDGLTVGFDEIADAARTDLGLAVTTMEEAADAAERMGMRFGDLTSLGRQVRDQFRLMALEIPVPTTELNQLGETIGQLGVDAEEIADVTRLVAMLGVATELSAEDAAFGLIRFMNVANDAGLSVEEFVRRAGSALVELGNTSVSTEGEILNLAVRIAAAGDAAHFTDQQILAWATTLSDVGSRAEAGGTAVSRMINEMLLAVQLGSDELELFAQVAGMSAEEFATAFREDASGALLVFITNLRTMIETGGLTEEMLNDMGLGGVRTRDIIGRLGEAVELFDSNLQHSNDAWERAIALEEEAARRFSTVQSEIQLLKNSFFDLGIEIFDLVEGDLRNLIRMIGNVIDWFKGLDDSTKAMILRLGAIVAAIGPLILIGGLLVSAIGAIVGTITSLGVAIIPVIAIVAALAAALVGLASAQPTVSLISNIPGLPEPAGRGGETRPAPATQREVPLVGQQVPDIREEPAPAPGGRAMAEMPQETNLQAILRLVDEIIGKIGDIGGQILGLFAVFDFEGLPLPPLEMFQQLLEDISRVLDRVMIQMQPIIERVREFLQNLVTDQLQHAWEQLSEAWDRIATDIFPRLAPYLERILPVALTLLIGIIADIIVGLANFIDAVATVINWITQIIDFFMDMGEIIERTRIHIDALLRTFSLDFSSISTLLAQLAGDFILFRDRFLQAFEEAGGALFNLLIRPVLVLVDNILDAFRGMSNDLVGHSIIPEMVNDILDWIENLSDGFLGTLSDMVDGVLRLVGDIGQRILSALGGGGGGATFNLFDPAALIQLQNAIRVLMESIAQVREMLGLIFTDLQLHLATVVLTLQTIPPIIQQIFGGLGTIIATNLIGALNSLQQAIAGMVSSFVSLGGALANSLTAPITAALTTFTASFIVQANFIDAYWLEVILHMVGHWRDFVVAAMALTDEFVIRTIMQFDKLHNVSVGKIHQIRDEMNDAFNSIFDNMAERGEQMANTFAGAMGQIHAAAGGAADAVWAAAIAMIAALEAVEDAATGSPELKIQHPFERFEKYLKHTDYAALIESGMNAPMLTEVQATLPMGAAAQSQSVDRSININAQGVAMSDEGEIVDSFLRYTRLAGASVS